MNWDVVWVIVLAIILLCLAFAFAQGGRGGGAAFGLLGAMVMTVVIWGYLTGQGQVSVKVMCPPRIQPECEAIRASAQKQAEDALRDKVGRP